MTESEDRLCPVFIIESPSADDFYDGTTERQHIASVLNFHQIPSEVRVALDREKFEKALDEFVSHVAKHSECPPILHVSAHGEVDGICFTDGECISWQEFCQLLKPAARQVNGGLIICMSSAMERARKKCNNSPDLNALSQIRLSHQSKRLHGPTRQLGLQPFTISVLLVIQLTIR